MTRQLVRELAPDEIGISVSYPLPGTRFHERVRARLGEKRNWRESDDLDPLFPGPFSRDFYRTLSRTVHAEFRTRRALRALRAMAAAPLTDGRTAMSARLACARWARRAADLARRSGPSLSYNSERADSEAPLRQTIALDGHFRRRYTPR